MPTYVYKFVETGETIEVQQAFTDDALTEAPHPGSGAPMPVKKVFQPVGVTFKGGGFYKTDSRGGGGKTSTSGIEPGSNGTEPSAPGSSDSGSSTKDGGTTPTPTPTTTTTTTTTPAPTPAAPTTPSTKPSTKPSTTTAPAASTSAR